MTGVIAAFAVIAVYAAIVLVAAIGAGLLLGAWSILSGRSDDGSQRFMRARVVASFRSLARVCA